MGAPRDFGLLTPAQKQLILDNMPDKVNARGYLIGGDGVSHLPIPADFNSSNILPMLEVLAIPIGGAIAAGFMTAAGGVGAAAQASANTGVGVGETASTVGLASGAGLPGAVAAPVAADAIAAAAPAVVAPAATATYGPAADAAAGGGGLTTGPVAPGAAASSWGPAGSAITPAAATTSSSLIPTIASVGGGIASSLIQANAQGNATAAQQKYLEEALAYEKQRDAAAIALEGQRYSNYSSNIAPYLASGNNANARMAGLLGLPAPPPVTTSSAPPYTATAPTTTASPLTLPSPATPASAPTSTGTVSLRAPDGTVQAVNAADVQHYLAAGAVMA